MSRESLLTACVNGAACPRALTKAARHTSICRPCYGRIIGLSAVYRKQLDELPFGVIELDDAGIVTAYNRAEAALARTQVEKVLGRNFFTEVAPCTAVREFEGRFRQFLDSDEKLEQFDFTFSFREGPVGVEIFMLHCDGQAAEEPGGGCVRIIVRRAGYQSERPGGVNIPASKK